MIRDARHDLNNYIRPRCLSASSPNTEVVKSEGALCSSQSESLLYPGAMHNSIIGNAPIIARLTSLLGQVASYARFLGSPHPPDNPTVSLSFSFRIHASLIQVMRSGSCQSGQCTALICGICYRGFRKQQMWRTTPKRDRARYGGNTGTHDPAGQPMSWVSVVSGVRGNSTTRFCRISQATALCYGERGMMVRTCAG